MKRSVDMKLSPMVGGYPIRFHFRSDLHLARKIWHMVMGLVIVFVYMSGCPRTTGVLILASVLGLDLFVENLRIKSDALNEKLLKVVGPLLRAHEVRQISTVPHYVSAAMIAIAVFPKPVAILSILYLACGDPIASFFGILYGNKGPRFKSGKSLIGTTAGVVVCFLVTFIYLKTLAVSDESVLAISVMGGLVGGTVELLPFDVDDNFTIPVISGFALWLMFMIFGI